MLTLAAICLFGQLAVPGLVCAQAYAVDAQSDFELGFAFDSTHSAVFIARQERGAGFIRPNGESAFGLDARAVAWVSRDPPPPTGLDEPSTRRIRRIVPPHSIHGPPSRRGDHHGIDGIT